MEPSVVTGIKFKPVDKHKTTMHKVDAFLQGLEFRVFRDFGLEMEVLSVYLDDDGAICIDVQEKSTPTAAAVNH
jgi:hypothetical protein